eukprot:6470304-Amphidinium_carterae.3
MPRPQQQQTRLWSDHVSLSCGVQVKLIWAGDGPRVHPRAILLVTLGSKCSCAARAGQSSSK